MKEEIKSTIRSIVKKYPATLRYLTGLARWVALTVPLEVGETKGVDDYRRRVVSLMLQVYNGDMGGEFIDGMAALISRQLFLAYKNGAADAGLYVDEFTSEMRQEIDNFILREYNYVDKLYRDLIDARIDGTSFDQFSNRANLWAQRWKEVNNAARTTVTRIFGGKLQWKLGATEEHCETCMPLSDKVAFASEWDKSGLKPQGKMLMCGGWHCDCSLEPTDRRRSPRVLDFLMSVPRK